MDHQISKDCVIFIALLVQCCIIKVNSNRAGAPNSVCDTMLPGHGPNPQDISSSPFSLEILDGVTTYTVGIPVTGKWDSTFSYSRF